MSGLDLLELRELPFRVQRRASPPQRLTIKMDIDEVVLVLFEGNPGSRRVFFELADKIPLIDPYVFPGLHAQGTIANWIDNLGVYEDKLWDLYKKVCGQDWALTGVVLRGGMLGATNRDALHRALKTGSDPDFDLDEIARQVQNTISGFHKIVPVKSGFQPPKPKPLGDER